MPKYEHAKPTTQYVTVLSHGINPSSMAARLDEFQRVPFFNVPFNQLLTLDAFERYSRDKALQYIDWKHWFHWCATKWLKDLCKHYDIKGDVTYSLGGHGVMGETILKTTRWRLEVGTTREITSHEYRMGGLGLTFAERETIESTLNSTLCTGVYTGCMFRMLNNANGVGEGQNHWASLRWLVENIDYWADYV